MKNILVFEDTVYIKPLNALLYRYCLLRQPGLIRFLFPRLWASLLKFFGLCKAPKYNRLMWRFLDYVKEADGKLRRFWSREGKKAYRLFNEDDNVWLTRFPERAVRPLADMMGARALSGTTIRLFTTKPLRKDGSCLLRTHIRRSLQRKPTLCSSAGGGSCAQPPSTGCGAL
jgi:hypothetical protein